MLDFQNLTEEQKQFFNDIWENHQQQDNNKNESVERFNAYAERRRKQEEEQAQAATVLKTMMK